MGGKVGLVGNGKGRGGERETSYPLLPLVTTGLLAAEWNALRLLFRFPSYLAINLTHLCSPPHQALCKH